MTDESARRLMDHYGITAEQQSVYRYGEFRYGNLSDAINYAEKVAGVAQVSELAATAKGS